LGEKQPAVNVKGSATLSVEFDIPRRAVTLQLNAAMSAAAPRTQLNECMLRACCCQSGVRSTSLATNRWSTFRSYE